MPTAVVVAIFTIIEGELAVLLIERAADPERGRWALPGGALTERESLDGAAIRKLRDETGVSDVFLEQLYTFDGLPGGDGIVVAYFALVNIGESRLRAELEWQPAWRPVGELETLAFGNERIIDYARQRLRNKLSYSNVAYSLLPESFTLRELQAVYEAITGVAIDKRNFRRRMQGLGIIQETGAVEKQTAHRPAKLFRFAQREPTVVDGK